jgi:L-lactate dehydrogenase complex protein LldF
MKLAAWAFGTPRRYRFAQRTVLPALRLLTKVPGLARIVPGPLAAWTSVRELPEPPRETFSEWWQGRRP